MKPLYSSDDYESFCEYEKQKGLDKKYWKNLPEMWREELRFRKEFEECLNNPEKMKNKDVEDIVKKALDEYSSKQDKWCGDIDTITAEAFAAHRVHDFQELQIKNLNKALDNKTKEIQEHQTAIDNLRGYISFLESRIKKFQYEIDNY